MERSTYHNVLLCWEILVIEPLSAKPKTAQRGQLWKNIADQLNRLSEHKFDVTHRAELRHRFIIRDGFKLLSEKFKNKMGAEEVASGIKREVNELDVLLEEILANKEAYNEGQISDLVSKKRKEELNKENADDISLKGNSTQKISNLRMKGLIVNSSDTKFNDSNFNSRGRIHSAVFLLWRHWSASLPSAE